MSQKMTASLFKSSVLASPKRCHIVGGAVSALLILLIVWVSVHPESFNVESGHSVEEIDAAKALIASRAQWDTRQKAASTLARSTAREIQQIQSWLPQQRTWQEIRSQVRSIAAQSEVQLVSLSKEREHVGFRIAVLRSDCELHGKYENVCRFLNAIANDGSPLWCDEITLIRDQQDPQPMKDISDSSIRSADVCVAKLSLRIPYVGDGTVASKLVGKSESHREPKNAI